MNEKLKKTTTKNKNITVPNMFATSNFFGIFKLVILLLSRKTPCSFLTLKILGQNALVLRFCYLYLYICLTTLTFRHLWSTTKRFSKVAKPRSLKITCKAALLRNFQDLQPVTL